MSSVQSRTESRIRVASRLSGFGQAVDSEPHCGLLDTASGELACQST